MKTKHVCNKLSYTAPVCKVYEMELEGFILDPLSQQKKNDTSSYPEQNEITCVRGDNEIMGNV